MSLKTVIVDLRGREGWSKSDRQRHATRGLVSPAWSDVNPLGFVPDTGIHTAPGWGEQDGNLPKDLVYQVIRDISLAHPFPDGQPMVLYQNGGYVLYGLNLASPGCAQALALALTDHCPWAKGVCFDYFTTTGWLLVERPGGMPRWATAAWFSDFDAGLRALAAYVRKNRPDWWITGYQWHQTPATSALDGPFVEDRYTRGLQLTTIRDYINSIAQDRGAQPTAILEMRDPASYSAGETAVIQAACEQYGWFLSRGKDATAVGSG